MGRTLEKKLSEAGYRMLGETEIEDIILSILEKKNTRFLKAIPYLIYLHKLDLEKIYAKTKQNELLEAIIKITRMIFLHEGIDRNLPNIGEKIKQPGHQKEIKLNFEEFKGEFKLQIAHSQPPALLLDKEKIYAERNLQMWLSQLFTKKEKHIISRLLNDKPMSKTEYEYYSRKTKKKLNAIVNLQDLAKSLLPLSPKVNPELFELKGYLEQWAEKERKMTSNLERFFITGNKMISCLFSGNERETQIVFIRPISQIKDPRCRLLINKYPEHNFN